MKTDLSYIKKLIKLLDSSDLSEIEIEEEGVKIKVVKNKPAESQPQIIQYAPPQVQQAPIQQTSQAEEKPAAIEKAPAKNNIVEIRSPIVGTFYRSPSPSADSYVKVGQSIEKGNVLCIIEAMKLMNEIESEHSGKIIKICVENAQPVEYNQILFLLEP